MKQSSRIAALSAQIDGRSAIFIYFQIGKNIGKKIFEQQ